MRRRRLAWKSAMLVWFLSATGCAGSYPPCRPVSIPPLPESVVKEAESSSSISDDVQTWLQDARRSFEEKSRP